MTMAIAWHGDERTLGRQDDSGDADADGMLAATSAGDARRA